MTEATAPPRGLLDLLPETRRRLMLTLKGNEPLPAAELAEAIGVTPSAVRQLLSTLEGAGLVRHDRQRNGPGRPRHLYRLTERGDALFPRRYGELAAELLGHAEELGEGEVEVLFRRRRDRRTAEARSRLEGLDFKARIRELGRILDEDGYLAEVRDDGDVLRIVERNCAIHGLARRYREACHSEIEFIRAVLPGARVRRVRHIASGEPTCTYEIRRTRTTPQEEATMPYPFELPDLGYAYDALEPHIDARTMEIHHSKHHQGYTNKLNGAIEDDADLHGYSAEQLLMGLAHLPAESRTAVRNNGGGYVNHALFWQVIAPGGAGAPGGALADAIDDAFGSLDAFQQKFEAAAGGQFGSGWGWLVVDPFGALRVHSTANQDNPLLQGATPILGVDVWEHAYYLNYQNRRGDYLSAFWNVVNWDVVSEKFEAARGGWIGNH